MLWKRHRSCRTYEQPPLKLKGCKLKRQNLLAPVLDNIRQELQLASKEEVMVLVVIFDRQCSLRNTDLDDLSNYLECSALEAMELMPSISALQQRGYIMAENKKEKLIAARNSCCARRCSTVWLRAVR